MPLFPNRARFAWLLLPLAVACGCRVSGRVEDPRTRQLDQDIAAAYHQPTELAAASHPAPAELAGPHPVEDYLRIGLAQNPEIDEARLRVESLAHRVPQAAALPDPTLNATVMPSPIQTAAGEQEFGLAMSQRLTRRSKLATRAAMAEQDVNQARAQLAETELKVAEQIRIGYARLQFVEQAIEIVESDREQLQVIENVVDRMYRVQQDVSQQDVLQVQVARSQLEAELIELQQQRRSAQAQLAALLHLSPETELGTVRDTDLDIALDESLDTLSARAIECRPELHAQLAALEKDRYASCLAELENQPDLTVGFNWIATSTDGISPVANGDDALMLSVGMNLPVYRRRIDAGIQEAETRALSSARRYDRLKDETLAEIADLVARIRSHRETLRLFREDILPKQQLTLEQSIEDYQVGKVDFLQMIDNWRKLLRYQINERRLVSDLQQAAASLARRLGAFELPESPAGAVGGTTDLDDKERPFILPVAAVGEESRS